MQGDSRDKHTYFIAWDFKQAIYLQHKERGKTISFIFSSDHQM